MKTAYEHYLLHKVRNLSDDDKILELAEILYNECYNNNQTAFDLVIKTGDNQFSFETFQKAAKLILNQE